MLLLAIGAHEAVTTISVLRAGRPDLVAVDEEVVALVFGEGAQRGEVRILRPGSE